MDSIKQLGQYLVDQGKLNPDALHAALEEQRISRELNPGSPDRLGNILVRNGFVTQGDIVDALKSNDYNQISSEQTLITACPSSLLIENRVMILTESQDTIDVATFNDEYAVEMALRQYYPNEMINFYPVDFAALDDYLRKIEYMDQDSSVILDRLIRRSLRIGVTDIHVYPPRHSTYSVFTRYLGVLQHAHEGDADEYHKMVAQIKDRSSVDLAEKRVPQDGSFQVEFNGQLIDMRVATVPSDGNEKVVIRLLDPNRVDPKLDQLGITRLNKWRAGFSEAQGLCLICGPTGSGKTTTLSSTVREVDRFGKSINTLEDPVEYRIPYITQVNINHQVGLDFARGLRSLMRADPDIIIVGEVRDAETAQYAMKAAETGHLVIGTLHTGSIEGSIQRLKDLSVDTSELRYLLRSVLVQRLMRTYCTACHGKGCERCNGSGYGGRTVVSEVEYFRSEDEVKEVTENKRWWPNMIEDAIDKAETDMTSFDEVVRVFGEPAVELLRKRGYKQYEAMA